MSRDLPASVSPPIRRGFTLVELLVVIGIIGMLLGLLVPAVQRARESARRGTCGNNIRQLALAMQSYVQQQGAFPPGRMGVNEMWSQHAHVLPFIEQQRLFDLIDFGTVASAAIRARVVPTFLCPSDPGHTTVVSGSNSGGPNNYRGNVGNLPRDAFATVGTPPTIDRQASFSKNNGIFVAGLPLLPAQITDGLSNTALLAESRVFEPWFSSSATADRQEARNACLGVQAGTESQVRTAGQNWTDGTLLCTHYNHVMLPNTRSCADSSSFEGDGSVTTASSHHVGGVGFALADGSTRFVANEIEEAIWWALGSRRAESREPPIPPW